MKKIRIFTADLGKDIILAARNIRDALELVGPRRGECSRLDCSIVVTAKLNESSQS